jgi:hypothetical protein
MTARTPITAEERERLRALLATAAVPVPWNGINVPTHVFVDGESPGNRRTQSRNAELALDAVNALPRLLDALDDAEAQLKTMTVMWNGLRDKINEQRAELAALRQQNARLVEALTAIDRLGYEARTPLAPLAALKDVLDKPIATTPTVVQETAQVLRELLCDHQAFFLIIFDEHAGAMPCAEDLLKRPQGERTRAADALRMWAARIEKGSAPDASRA